MADQIAPSVTAPRQPRGAAMRLRLMRATIETLTSLGYGGTTTTEVVRRAGVSRGAMLHHFATRADLLVATADYILSEQETFRRKRLAGVERGVPRFFSITDAMWETMQRDESIALTELMLGSRGDPEVRDRFGALMRAASSRLSQGPDEVAEDIGYADQRLVRAMARLHVAAMRGLIIERRYIDGDDAAAASDDAFELLVWYKQAVMRRLTDPDFEQQIELGMSRPLKD